MMLRLNATVLYECGVIANEYSGRGCDVHLAAQMKTYLVIGDGTVHPKLQ